LLYVRKLLDMSRISVLKFVSGNNFKEYCTLISGILTDSENLIIRSENMYSQDWESKSSLFYCISFLAYCVTILWYISSLIVVLFCGGLVVVRTSWKMPYSACLLSRKVAIETVRNFARFENSAVPIDWIESINRHSESIGINQSIELKTPPNWKLRVGFVSLPGARVDCFMIRGYSIGKRLRTPGLDKELFKIKWLQTTYNVKWTFTQKQIPTQNEKFNLFSSNKVSV